MDKLNKIQQRIRVLLGLGNDKSLEQMKKDLEKLNMFESDHMKQLEEYERQQQRDKELTAAQLKRIGEIEEKMNEKQYVSGEDIGNQIEECTYSYTIEYMLRDKLLLFLIFVLDIDDTLDSYINTIYDNIKHKCFKKDYNTNRVEQDIKDIIKITLEVIKLSEYGTKTFFDEILNFYFKENKITKEDVDEIDKIIYLSNPNDPGERNIYITYITKCLDKYKLNFINILNSYPKDNLSPDDIFYNIDNLVFDDIGYNIKSLRNYNTYSEFKIPEVGDKINKYEEDLKKLISPKTPSASFGRRRSLRAQRHRNKEMVSKRRQKRRSLRRLFN